MYFKDRLNGIQITAALNRTKNGKPFVYLFAGRMLCRQELSKKSVKVCDIVDIADWIDCSDIEELPSKSNVLFVIIGLFIGFVFIVIVVIAITVYTTKRRTIKTNLREESSLQFITSSNVNLRSDIPSPKPIESNEQLIAKRSEPSINKNRENIQCNTSFTDL